MKRLAGNGCMVYGSLQFHTVENMMQKVKLAQNQDGSAINFAMVMGGVIIEPETTLLPLSHGPEAVAPAHSHLKG